MCYIRAPHQKEKTMKPLKRSNKIDNADLFTTAAGAHYQKHIKTQSKQSLKFINEKIDWKKLLQPIERVLSQEKAGRSSSGRPPHDLLVIVKCFLLQSIYNLSDPRLEEEIADRRSFQLFLGLSSGDSIPDETAICRYRELFARFGLDKKLFSSFNKQLEERRMIVGKGTIVDATIKEAQATPNSKRDSDAQFTVRRGKTHYGYKGHIGMDDQTDVIHTAEFTTANVHDSNMFDELLLGTEKRVHADKGYANKERRITLRKAGIVPKIMHKGYRNRPLTKMQIAQNKIFSQTRNAVEKPFAFMTVVLNYTRCKYYDFKRNRFQFSMAALVYNIRRMITLTPKRVR
jgi:IS5 family transposase